MDCGKCELGVGLKAKSSSLYKSWKEFAIGNGVEPGSSVQFAAMMAQRRFEAKKSGNIIYKGIGLQSVSKLDFSNDL